MTEVESKSRYRESEIVSRRAYYEELDPCRKEHDSSLECLDKNNYDKDACGMHFDNYNTCKDFWSYVRRDRWWKGIYPTLPVPEEREEIKAMYAAKFFKR